MSDLADIRWTVLINDEEQYGLHPASAPVPAGWYEDGFQGTEDECIDHVDRLWTDMRPRSLREAMDGKASMSGIPVNGSQAHGR